MLTSLPFVPLCGQMLADSYREVTGRTMPATMTAEEAYAELRLITMAAWQGDDEADAPADAADEPASPQGGTILDRMRKGVRKSRVRAWLLLCRWLA